MLLFVFGMIVGGIIGVFATVLTSGGHDDDSDLRR